MENISDIIGDLPKLSKNGQRNSKQQNDKPPSEEKSLGEDPSSGKSVWNAWNPMSEAAGSFRNTLSYKTDNPGALISGRAPEMVQMTPCPFQKEPNKPCFKGRLCQFKHGEYTPQILKDHPILAASASAEIVDVMLAKNLPKSRLPSNKCLSMAWTTTVISPAEFYIVTENSWKCLCIPYDDHDDCGNEQTRCGFKDFDILWKSMQSHYSQVKDRTLACTAGQLVAVSVNLDDGAGSGKGWYRAVVLEDTERDFDSDAAPEVLVKLLDFETELYKSTLDVASLHEKFCYVGPMAYKCQLFGISPLPESWRKKTTDFFKGLVAGQVILVEVVQTVQMDGLFGLFSKTPMSLNLFTKYEEHYTSITKLFSEKGLGIQRSPFPPFAAEVSDLEIDEHAACHSKTYLDEKLAEWKREDDSRLQAHCDKLKPEIHLKKRKHRYKKKLW